MTQLSFGSVNRAISDMTRALLSFHEHLAGRNEVIKDLMLAACSSAVKLANLRDYVRCNDVIWLAIATALIGRASIKVTAQ